MKKVKKIIALIIFILIIILIGSIIIIMNNNSNTNNERTQTNERINTEQNIENVLNAVNSEATKNNVNSGDKKILVAYFSLPETTGTAKEDSTITVNGETLGNTQYVANLIQEHTGADVFRIEPVKEYNIKDHQALIDDAKEEQNNDDRPEIRNRISNFEDYDTIFIGYPTWWSDLPQILYTFLGNYDFKEKNIYLFSTNGGSGLAGTVSTIENKLSSANVNKNAFKLNRDNMEDAPVEVESWLKEIGF